MHKEIFIGEDKMRFFDRTTKTLFITKGRTNPSEISENPIIQIPDPSPLPVLSLRRQTAGYPQHYISTQTGDTFFGAYDMNHETNSDLEKLDATISCP